MTSRLSRRGLLPVAAAILALPYPGRTPRAAALPTAQLAAVLPDPEGAAAIGRRLLDRGIVRPDDAQALGGALAAAADGDAARRAFAAARADDFAQGHVVIADGGWVLARAEARLCALAAVTLDLAAGVAA